MQKKKDKTKGREEMRENDKTRARDEREICLCFMQKEEIIYSCVSGNMR